MTPSPLFFALGWLVLLACMAVIWEEARNGAEPVQNIADQE
jgi:predicted small integral membrane protein